MLTGTCLIKDQAPELSEVGKATLGGQLRAPDKSALYFMAYKGYRIRAGKIRRMGSFDIAYKTNNDKWLKSYVWWATSPNDTQNIGE